MKTELTHDMRLISKTGGTIDYVSDDGELLASVSVAPGLHFPAQYLELVPDDAHIELSGDLVALKPRTRVTVQPYSHGPEQTGANPDFRPTSARRNELEMRMVLDRLKATDKRLLAREKALANIERIPKAPDPDPVIEPIPDAAPADPVKPVVK